MENVASVKSDLDREFVISRNFEATKEQVYEAWTNPLHVQNWWGPENFTVPHCTIDLRPGGSFHFCTRSPSGDDIWNKGFYRVIEAPGKIVSTIFFSDKEGNFIAPSRYGIGPDFPAEMLTTVLIEDIGNGRTQLSLKSGCSESTAKRYHFDRDWQQSLNRLAQEIKRDSRTHL